MEVRTQELGISWKKFKVYQKDIAPAILFALDKQNTEG